MALTNYAVSLLRPDGLCVERVFKAGELVTTLLELIPGDSNGEGMHDFISNYKLINSSKIKLHLKLKNKSKERKMAAKPVAEVSHEAKDLADRIAKQLLQEEEKAKEEKVGEKGEKESTSTSKGNSSAGGGKEKKK